MLLAAHAETLWLATMPEIEEPAHRGLFAGRALSGSNWLADQPPEDRRVFSELGRRALSTRGINWHQAGGRARQRAALRDSHGRYLPDWGPF